MMKNFMFLFIIFSLTSTQVMALSCGAICAIEEQVTNADMSAHDCCASSNKKDKKKDQSSCMDNGSCLHEFASEKSLFKASTTLIEKIVVFNELSSLELIKKVGIHNRYLPKIPDDQFLKFKSNLDLYILKDQFLI